MKAMNARPSYRAKGARVKRYDSEISRELSLPCAGSPGSSPWRASTYLRGETLKLKVRFLPPWGNKAEELGVKLRFLRHSLRHSVLFAFRGQQYSR